MKLQTGCRLQLTADLLAPVVDGHTEDTLGPVARLEVHVTIKATVCVGVRDV